MRKILLVATLAAVPAIAFAQTADCTKLLSPDNALGKTEDEVKASLTGMGYEIKKADTEDGKIEVYFVKDKVMGEVYVSPETGMITKMSYETE